MADTKLQSLDHKDTVVGTDPVPIAETVYTAVSVTGATQANPVEITAASHGLSTGQEVFLADIVGMTELNDRTFVVTVTSASTFTLDDEDGTGHTAYVSGGVAIRGRLQWASVAEIVAAGSGDILGTGESGGRTLVGGTDAADDLTLSSTSNATKGDILFGTTGVFEEDNGVLGVGTTTPADNIELVTPTHGGLSIRSNGGGWAHFQLRSDADGNDYRQRFELSGSTGQLQVRLGQGVTGVDGTSDSVILAEQDHDVIIGGAGQSPVGRLDVRNVAGTASQPVFNARMHASQTGPMIRIQNSTGGADRYVVTAGGQVDANIGLSGGFAFIGFENSKIITTAGELLLYSLNAQAARLDNSTTAGNTRMQVWDVTAGALKRVKRSPDTDSNGDPFLVLEQ